jgi:hypothetical protein
MMLVGLPTAQAADEVLTLACQGTTRVSIDGPPWSPDEPSSMSLIVNLTTRTVTGFRYQDTTGYDDIPVVAITAINELTVMFAGTKKYGEWPDGSDNSHTLTGTIDRVTGDVHVTWKGGTVIRTHSLKCRPAQRMF